MFGIVLINKGKGLTSRDVVNLVSKKLNTKKVGHAGTLDPLATGLLVIGIGRGTKLLDILTLDTKEYIAEVKLGILTDTLDITGNIISEDINVNVKKEQLEKILESFIGEYLQEVPKYSAVKVDGKRLYQYARSDEEVILPKRLVSIKEIELLNFDLENKTFTFRTLVSKGTYIRSLIKDIGDKLKIYCTMQNLLRTKSGKFKIQDSIIIEEIDENKIIPVDEVLDYPVEVIDGELLKKVLNGNQINYCHQSEFVIFSDSNKNILAIYQKIDDVNFKAFKVF